MIHVSSYCWLLQSNYRIICPFSHWLGALIFFIVKNLCIDFQTCTVVHLRQNNADQVTATDTPDDQHMRHDCLLIWAESTVVCFAKQFAPQHDQQDTHTNVHPDSTHLADVIFGTLTLKTPAIWNSESRDFYGSLWGGAGCVYLSMKSIRPEIERFEDDLQLWDVKDDDCGDNGCDTGEKTPSHHNTLCCALIGPHWSRDPHTGYWLAGTWGMTLRATLPPPHDQDPCHGLSCQEIRGDTRVVRKTSET